MAAEGNMALVEQFIAVTGADRDVAVSFLEACAGDLDMAVGMHMDSGGVNISSNQREGCPSTLIDECEDDVRAPIPQRTEVLVEDDSNRLSGSWRIRRHRQHRSVFDGLRNFQAEAALHVNEHLEESQRGKKTSKKRSLEELYRPPVTITFKGTFQSARDAGSLHNRWLLVNVQNVQEFSCQLLNRDVWSSLESRTAIKENFIFWQVYNDSEEGKWFMQFYHVTKWPYVAIIDPFTGEMQVEWNKIADGRVFCELVKEFLSSYPVPDNSLITAASKRQKREPSILDASEQEQMEAAIRLSLAENKTNSSSPQYVFDSDSEADASGNTDDVETLSDSCDVIFSALPGSSNGVSSSQLPTSSAPPASSRTNSLSKSDNIYQHRRLSNSQPSSSTLPSTSNASSSLGARRNIRTLVSSIDCESRSMSQPYAENNEPGSWLRVPSLQTDRDSPLEVNIESSLIDMIGCREAEVGTPDTLTLGDDSPSDSQLSLPDRESAKELPVSQGSCNQSSNQTGNSWTDYWGHPSDPSISIVIRFPNNNREQVQLPCTSQLKALTTFCSDHGFPSDKYELVANYPRRRLSQMSSSMSLKEAGLHQQETVFVQDL